MCGDGKSQVEQISLILALVDNQALTFIAGRLQQHVFPQIFEGVRFTVELPIFGK